MCSLHSRKIFDELTLNEPVKSSQDIFLAKWAVDYSYYSLLLMFAAILHLLLYEFHTSFVVRRIVSKSLHPRFQPVSCVFNSKLPATFSLRLSIQITTLAVKPAITVE